MPIDRQALVRRHSPTLTDWNPLSALSVGNGSLAFTADLTGLQTFPDLYRERFPLCTTAHWAWHSAPMPPEVRGHSFRFTDYDTHGRSVPYATSKTGQETLYEYLRKNPHRMHLGRIGLDLRRGDGSLAASGDLQDATQTLDLWTGVLHSRFTLDGQPVRVETACHPDLDMIAVRVESSLIASGRLRLLLAFPYPTPEMAMADWAATDRHASALHRSGDRAATIDRSADADRYHADLAWSAGGILDVTGPHTFVLSGTGDLLEFCCRFSSGPAPQGGGVALPSGGETRDASARHWSGFWRTGGVVDFSDCTDPRAHELERRVVLSQYNTALHSAGPMPPAETGLLCSSWYGKPHLEMHWWHAAHFAYWGRFDLLQRSLPWYPQISHVGRETARRQGYAGVRWPKMVGPDGADSPSPVAPLLIWQQPHPIYYAELAFRHRPERATLEQWRPLIEETADFMASFAVKVGDRYVLGPPLKTVSENTNERETRDPTFELGYWRFGLRVASEWFRRLGLLPKPEWETVRAHLAPLPEADGCYLMQEGMDDTYTHWNWEHPALVGAYGMLPGDGADRETMRQTVRRVLKTWQWERKNWGWDFPLVALAAARVGEPELALDALLLDVPKNRYGANGHVFQRDDLPAYLPANGGLLAAVGMMAAGWEGGPQEDAPGFPKDGRWQVRWEGIERYL